MAPHRFFPEEVIMTNGVPFKIGPQGSTKNHKFCSLAVPAKLLQTIGFLSTILMVQLLSP